MALAAAAVVAAGAVVSEWGQVGGAVDRLGAGPVLLALLLSLLNVALAGAAWRSALAAVGSQVPVGAAARIYLMGQLGKYLPGGVVQVVTQVELGQELGVARRRTASAVVLQMTLTVTTALMVVFAAAPFAPVAGPAPTRWAWVLVPPLLVAVHPKVFNRAAAAVFRRFGRPGLGVTGSWRTTLSAVGWSLASWAAVGLQVLVLATSLGVQISTQTVALCMGGFALAWLVGFVVVVAPAGAGGRDAMLAVALAPILDRGSLVVLVLTSRVLLTVPDLVLAGATGLCRPRRQQPR